MDQWFSKWGLLSNSSSSIWELVGNAHLPIPALGDALNPSLLKIVSCEWIPLTLDVRCQGGLICFSQVDAAGWEELLFASDLRKGDDKFCTCRFQDPGASINSLLSLSLPTWPFPGMLKSYRMPDLLSVGADSYIVAQHLNNFPYLFWKQYSISPQMALWHASMSSLE